MYASGNWLVTKLLASMIFPSSPFLLFTSAPVALRSWGSISNQANLRLWCYWFFGGITTIPSDGFENAVFRLRSFSWRFFAFLTFLKNVFTLCLVQIIPQLVPTLPFISFLQDTLAAAP
jgi:hypothetical protein